MWCRNAKARMSCMFHAMHEVLLRLRAACLLWSDQETKGPQGVSHSLLLGYRRKPGRGKQKLKGNGGPRPQGEGKAGGGEGRRREERKTGREKREGKGEIESTD